MEAIKIEAIKINTIMDKKIRNCKETRSSLKNPAIAILGISLSNFFVKLETQHDEYRE